jgi:uncharacterized protein (DUF433 family)
MASRHGWTPSDASARLVEEGLRRSEFAFIDFRDSAAGRKAYIQGSTLAVWEVLLLARNYKGDVAAVAKHLGWPEAKVQAAINYAQTVPDEIEEALSENAGADFESLKRMLPGTVRVGSRRVRSRVMLKLLLDEHISPRVGIALRRRHRSLTVHLMVEWENGRFLGQDDTACVEHAAEQKITLVTYDRRSIPSYLKREPKPGESRAESSSLTRRPSRRPMSVLRCELSQVW